MDNEEKNRWLNYIVWKEKLSYQVGRVVVIIFLVLIIIGVFYFISDETKTNKGDWSKLSAAELTQIEQKLKERPELKGNELYVYLGVNFDSNGLINIGIQNPTDSSKSLDYQYNPIDKNWESKGSSDMNSEPYIKNGKVVDGFGSEIYPLDSIPFSAVANILTAYREKVVSLGVPKDSITANASSLTFILPQNTPPDMALNAGVWHWRVGFICINDTYYDFTFNKDGALIDFQKREK